MKNMKTFRFRLQHAAQERKTPGNPVTNPENQKVFLLTGNIATRGVITVISRKAISPLTLSRLLFTRYRKKTGPISSVFLYHNDDTGDPFSGFSFPIFYGCGSCMAG